MKKTSKELVEEMLNEKNNYIDNKKSYLKLIEQEVDNVRTLIFHEEYEKARLTGIHQTLIEEEQNKELNIPIVDGDTSNQGKYPDIMYCNNNSELPIEEGTPVRLTTKINYTPIKKRGPNRITKLQHIVNEAQINPVVKKYTKKFSPETIAAKNQRLHEVREIMKEGFSRKEAWAQYKLRHGLTTQEAIAEEKKSVEKDNAIVELWNKTEPPKEMVFRPKCNNCNVELNEMERDQALGVCESCQSKSYVDNFEGK